MKPLPPFTSSELRDLNLTEEEYHVLDYIVTSDLAPSWRGIPSLLSAVEMLILNGLVAMPADPESTDPEASEEGISVSESFEALDYDQIKKVVYRIGDHQEYSGASVAQAISVANSARIQPGDLIRHVWNGMIGICTEMGSAKLTFGINGDKTTIDVRDNWCLMSKLSSEVV